MKKFTAILLLLCALLSAVFMASCQAEGNDDPTQTKKPEPTFVSNPLNPVGPENASPIAGIWTGELDLANLMNLAFEGDESLAVLKLTSFPVTGTLTFGYAGQYTLALSEEEFKASLDQAKDIWVEGYTDIMEKQIAASEEDITLDDLLAQLGYDSMEAYVDAVVSQIRYTDMEDSGSFEYEEGKLTLDGKEFRVSLEDGTLKVLGYDGNDEYARELMLMLEGAIFAAQ